MFDCLLFLIPISHKVDLVRGYQPLTGISTACGDNSLAANLEFGASALLPDVLPVALVACC